jgi:hypothetical protein
VRDRNAEKPRIRDGENYRARERTDESWPGKDVFVARDRVGSGNGRECDACS